MTTSRPSPASPVDPCVLVGVTGREEAAVRHAASRALQLGLPLRLVHVWDLPPIGLRTEDPIGMVRTREREAAALVADARRLAEEIGDVEIRDEVLRGPTRDVLLLAASRAREVVLGPDVAPWAVRLFTGNVAHALAAEAPVPVVVVPDAWDPGPGRDRIVVALSAGSHAHGPLQYAFDAADASGGSLTILHVVEERDPGQRARVWNQLEWALDSWEARYHRVPVARHTVDGHAVDVALDVARRSSLVVAGKPGPGSRPHVLHHHFSQALIRAAACPVAVVPDHYSP